MHGSILLSGPDSSLYIAPILGAEDSGLPSLIPLEEGDLCTRPNSRLIQFEHTAKYVRPFRSNIVYKCGLVSSSDSPVYYLNIFGRDFKKEAVK